MTSIFDDLLPPTRATVRRGWMTPSPRAMLLVLLTADAVLVVLHLGLVFTEWLQDPRF